MTKQSATLTVTYLLQTPPPVPLTRQPRHSMPQLVRLHLNNITYNYIKRIAVSECMGSKGQDGAGEVLNHFYPGLSASGHKLIL